MIVRLPQQGFAGLVMRVVLVLMGLVFMISLVVVTVLLLGLWSLRALWARLRGRPVAPPMFAYWRHSRWQRFRTPGRAAPDGAEEIIDVQARAVDDGENQAQRPLR